MTLNELKAGECAEILAIGGEGSLRQHFLDMGLIPGAEIKLVQLAPMGDPMELMVHGYELTLRLEDARKIEINRIQEIHTDQAYDKSGLCQSDKKGYRICHPGLGEGGKFHSKEDENPLPDDEQITFALVGNQNCGKTTLFNQLTGSNQHVGNFPGVTVDRKDGQIKGYPNTLVTDLPGIYSMSPYSKEEIVSRNFVLESKPKAIINIADATNVERNLYLSMQLMEMGIPMVLALNMMDELTGNGGTIDVNAMEEALGIPVVPIAAAKGQGIEELVDHAMHVAYYQEKPLRQDFCDEKDHKGAVHRCLHAVAHLIEDHAVAAGIPVRFAAGKVIEGDHLILEALNLDENEKEMIEHIVLQMEKERGLDRSAAIADMRYSFIKKVCKRAVVKPRESKEHARSRKIDRILTGKYTAIPGFILIMFGVFFLTFGVIGKYLQELMELGIDALTQLVDSGLTNLQVNDVLHSLIIDGIFAGVGSVLSFLPIIASLFFFLSLLEDSGYIARVAFVMDKLLRKIGLSGKSIVPLLIGFGCSVPAVMATRTLPSDRDRKMTILLTPFMSCSAKLPIFAFFSQAFFPEYSALVMIGLYLLSILIGILVAIIYRGLHFKGEAVPFVMELPNYRLPGIKNVAQLLWEKSRDFLQRAFTVILIATIVVWFLQSFDFGLNLVENSSDSIMAKVSGVLAPIFIPAGLGDWRIVTSLISGFMAKESIVSTMDLLFAGNVTAALSSCQAAALLIFSLLYTPCVAAIASVRREMGKKWAIFVVLWQCFLAWGVATLIYQLMHLIIR